MINFAEYILRADQKARDLFETLDKLKNKITLTPFEMQKIKALKKAYKEFEQSNQAFIKAMNRKSKVKISLARDLASKKYQNFLTHYDKGLPVLTQESTRDKEYIDENKKLHKETFEHCFYNEMAALFQLPTKELDLIQDHGVIVDAIEKHLQPEIKDAIKIVTDDQRLNELTQFHELAMLKASTFSYILDNYNLSQNNTFSTAYTKMLHARKLFIESVSKGVKIEERLDTLKEAIYHYKEQLALMKKLLADNPLSKIKIAAAAKNKKDADHLEQEGIEKMMCHIKTAELIETIDQLPNQATTRAEYFLDKLNEFDQAMLQEKTNEAVRFIQEKGLISSPLNVNSPQQFLKEKLDLFKAAEQKLVFEKAAFDKKYSELVTFYSYKITKYEEAAQKFEQEKTAHEKRSLKLGKSKSYVEAEENLARAKRQVELGEDKLRKAQRLLELAKETLREAQKNLELANHVIFRIVRLAYFTQVRNEAAKSNDLETHPAKMTEAPKFHPELKIDVAAPQSVQTPKSPLMANLRIEMSTANSPVSLFRSERPVSKLAFGRSIEPLRKKKDSLILLHTKKLKGMSIFKASKSDNTQVVKQEETRALKLGFNNDQE